MYCNGLIAHSLLIRSYSFNAFWSALMADDLYSPVKNSPFSEVYST